MGAIAKLDPVQTGAIYALPNIGDKTTTDQADASAFQATAGEFRKGLRSTSIAIGAGVEALIGQAGQALGLNEFAADRYQAAKESVKFADLVGPAVTDYAAVKDFTSAVNFGAGILGSAAASAGPMIAAGVALRRPVAPIVAGSGIMGAGETALNTESDPTAAARSPGTKLGTSLAAGGAMGWLDTLGGEGRVVRQILSPGQRAKNLGTALGKASAAEAGTEAAQQLVGQGAQSSLNPDRDKSGDTGELINAAVAGGIGGAGMGAAGHAVSALPSLAKGSKEWYDERMKRPTVDTIREDLGAKDAPIDPDPEDVPEELTSVEDISTFLENAARDGKEGLKKAWEAGKDKWQDLGGWEGSAEKTKELYRRVKKDYIDTEVAPRAKAMADGIKDFVEGVGQGAKDELAKGKAKKSLMRSKDDEALFDYVDKLVPGDVKEALGPENMIVLVDNIKALANTPGTKIPRQLVGMFGDKSEDVISKAREIFNAKFADTVNDDIKKHSEMSAGVDESIQDLIRGAMHPAAYANREIREEVINILTPRLKNYIENGVESKDLMTNLAAIFGSKEEARAEIELMRQRVQDYDTTYTSAGATSPEAEFEDNRGDAWEDPVPQVGSLAEEMSDKMPPKVAEVFNDARLAKLYTPVEARTMLADLRAEYGNKVTFRTIKEGASRRIVADDRVSDESGFDDVSFDKIKENPRYGRSGLENGILTVRRDMDVTKTGSYQPVKVNLMNLVNHMAERYQADFDKVESKDRSNRIGEMLFRGLSQLMSDPNVDPKKPFGNLQSGPDGFSIPDNTLVYRTKDKEWRWKDVKTFKITRDELRGYSAEDVAKLRNDKKVSRAEAIDTLKKRVKRTEEQKSFGQDEVGQFRDKEQRQGPAAAPSMTDKAATHEKVEAREAMDKERDAVMGDERAFDKDKKSISQKDAIEAKYAGRIEPKRMISESLESEGKLANDKRVEFSKVGLGKRQITEKQKKAVRAYVEKVLGKEKTNVVFAKMAEAGSFIEDDDGVQTLRISIAAIDPMSVAYHEALHGLMAKLAQADPKAAELLKRVSTSPTVMAQLHALLKRHPEARKQLSDPEEAAAYMYQFWAAGKLSVGPRADTMFGRIKNYLKTILGYITGTDSTPANLERARRIFEAFHSGELADRSTVAKVLNERAPQAYDAVLKEASGPIFETISKIMYTADGRIRSLKMKPLDDLVDRFHTPIDNPGKEQGYVQVNMTERQRRINAWTKDIGEVTDKDMRQAIEILQLEEKAPDLKNYPNSVRKIVTATRKHLDELFDYQIKAGVKRLKLDGKYEEIAKRDHYFPQVWDANYVEAHQQEFAELLLSHGYDPTLALRTILRDNQAAKPSEDDMHAGITYFHPATQKRVLVNLPRDEVAKFLEKDLGTTMLNYIARSVRRAEYTRRFDNSGEKIEALIGEARKLGLSAEQEKSVRMAVQAMEGSLSPEMSRDLKAVWGGLMTYQNIRLLPLALFSNIVDPLGILVRGGELKDVFDTYKRGLQSLYKAAKAGDDGYDMAAAIGAISAAHDYGMMSEMYGMQFVKPWQRKANDFFFKYNGMEGWNQANRIGATMAAEKFIIRHATKPTEHSERYLRELGLTAAQVKQSMSGGHLNTADQKITQALNTWVDSAIIRPNAAIRPVWMSDPMWMLVSHLKQFTYAFQKVIIARVAHEASNGNMQPLGVLLSFVPMMIASDMLKVFLTPQDDDDKFRANWGAADWVWSGMQRSGMFGPAQWLLDPFKPGYSATDLAGPTVQQLADLAGAIGGDGTVATQVGKAVPGFQVFGNMGKE